MGSLTAPCPECQAQNVIAYDGERPCPDDIAVCDRCGRRYSMRRWLKARNRTPEMQVHQQTQRQIRRQERREARKQAWDAWWNKREEKWHREKAKHRSRVEQREDRRLARENQERIVLTPVYRIAFGLWPYTIAAVIAIAAASQNPIDGITAAVVGIWSAGFLIIYYIVRATEATDRLNDLIRYIYVQDLARRNAPPPASDQAKEHPPAATASDQASASPDPRS